MPAISISARLALFYAAFFAVSGIQLPFWPVWLQAQGLGPAQMSVLLTVGVWARIVANPLFAHLADRRGARRGSIVLLAWASPLVLACYFVADGFWQLLGISVVLGFLWSPIMPLGESLALLVAYRDKLDYGRIRVWGSISFMLATIASGWLLAGRGASVILTMVLSTMLLNAAVCHLLPEVRIEPEAPTTGPPVAQLLRQPTFALFLLGSSLIQCSHAAYYGFSAVYWQSQGFSGTVISILWAEGVVAEILLFIVSGALLSRISPLALLLIGGLAGILRWTGTATTTDLLILIPLQAMHGLTFGAAHLGAMHYISRAIPADQSASAQSLYSISTGGIALGLAMLAAGPLYAEFGPGAFIAMAVLSAIGAVAVAILKQLWPSSSMHR